MKIELILLAAGKSKRFSGIKQLADIHGQPMVCHCLSQYRQGENWLSGLNNGYVMLGANAELISRVLPSHIRRYVLNSWSNGMGHTLASGMENISCDTSHVLVGLADQIALNQDMIHSLLDKAHAFPGYMIAAKYKGNFGVPAIFPRDYFSQLKQLKGDAGAKTLLLNHLEQVKGIAIPEAAFDIDTQGDLKNFNSIGNLT